MKKYTIFLIAFILLLKLAGAETQIFSGKVITDQDKVIENNIFRFRYDETSNKIYAQTPSTNLIIDNGACKSNALFRICITNATFYDKNITTYVYYYEIDLKIYKLTGSLTPTTLLGSNALLPNEPTTFQITITNPTDFDILNIKYIENLDPFYVTEVTGCTLANSQLSWQGSLKPRFDKICTAKIVTSMSGNHIFTGNLSYFNGYETKNETTDSASVTVAQKQLKVTRIIDNNTGLQQPFYINYSLQNVNLNERLEGVMTIDVPSNVKIIEYIPYLNQNGNVLRQTLILDPSKMFNFSLYLEQTSTSDAPIKEKYEYTIKNVFDTLENYTLISVPEIKPVVIITSEYPEVMIGQKFIVVVNLKNPSKIYSLSAIEATLIVPNNNNIVQKLDKLDPGQSYPIISNILTSPNSSSGLDKLKLDLSIKYSFNGFVSYLNSSSEVKLKQEQQTTTNTETQAPAAEENKSVITSVSESIGNQTEAISTIVQEIITTKPRIDFSDKRVIIFAAVIFTLIVIIPVSIFIIKRAMKNKKEMAQEKFVQEEIENINKPKDF